MKKLVRKTMFVLSFLGLFTFVAPKLAKAESGPETEPGQFCAKYTCTNGLNGYICGPDELIVYKAIAEICGIQIEVLD